MKRLHSMLPAAFLAAAAMAGSAFAGISGSAHDFGQAKYTWSTGQICAPCHIPHNAAKQLAGSDLNAPLWNHTLPASFSYTLFGGAAGNVDTNSILCLSCHDGTIALDSFGGGAGTSAFITGTEGTYGSANLGTDLSNDHPMGAAAAITDPSYMVAQSFRDTAGIMPARYLTDGTTKVVGCTSCHEPHNRKALPHLLWAPVSGAYTTVDARAVDGSGLCMNCHKK